MKKTNGRKVRIRATMRLKAYPILCDALEKGIASGWHKSHKHGEPTEEMLREAIYDEVLNALCEVLDFDSKRDE